MGRIDDALNNEFSKIRETLEKGQKMIKSYVLDADNISIEFNTKRLTQDAMDQIEDVFSRIQKQLKRDKLSVNIPKIDFDNGKHPYYLSDWFVEDLNDSNNNWEDVVYDYSYRIESVEKTLNSFDVSKFRDSFESIFPDKPLEDFQKYEDRIYDAKLKVDQAISMIELDVDNSDFKPLQDFYEIIDKVYSGESSYDAVSKFNLSKYTEEEIDRFRKLSEQYSSIFGKKSRMYQEVDKLNTLIDAGAFKKSGIDTVISKLDELFNALNEIDPDSGIGKYIGIFKDFVSGSRNAKESANEMYDTFQKLNSSKVIPTYGIDNINLIGKSESELVELYKKEKQAIKSCTDEEKAYHEAQKARIKDLLSSSSNYKYRGGKADTFAKITQNATLFGDTGLSTINESEKLLRIKTDIANKEKEISDLEQEQLRLESEKINATKNTNNIAEYAQAASPYLLKINEIKENIELAKSELQHLRADYIQEQLESMDSTTEVWFRRVHDIKEILQDTGAFFAKDLRVSETYFDPDSNDRLVSANVDTSNFLTVDADYNRWNKLFGICDSLIEKSKELGVSLDDLEDKERNVFYGNTKWIADAAKRLGYNGVRIKNVKDVGAYGDNYDLAGDIIQAFNSNLVSNVHDVTDAYRGLTTELERIQLVSQVVFNAPKRIPFDLDGIEKFTQDEQMVWNKMMDIRTLMTEMRHWTGDNREISDNFEPLLKSLRLGEITLEDFLSKYDELFNKYKSILDSISIDDKINIVQNHLDNATKNFRRGLLPQTTVEKIETELKELQELKANQNGVLSGNTAPLVEEQERLRNEIDETEKKLESLREEYKHLHETVGQTGNGTPEEVQRYFSLENEIDECVKKVEDLNFQLLHVGQSPEQLDLVNQIDELIKKRNSVNLQLGGFGGVDKNQLEENKSLYKEYTNQINALREKLGLENEILIRETGLTEEEKQSSQILASLRMTVVQKQVEELYGTTNLWYRRIKDVNETLADTGGFFARTLRYAGTYFDVKNPDRNLIATPIDTSKVLKLDANGEQWNELYQLCYKLMEMADTARVNLDNLSKIGNGVEFGNTKWIANAAKELGYLGIQIDNVIDVGGYGDNWLESGSILQIFDKNLLPEKIYNVTNAVRGLTDGIQEINKVTQKSFNLPVYTGIYSESIGLAKTQNHTDDEMRVFNMLFDYIENKGGEVISGLFFKAEDLSRQLKKTLGVDLKKAFEDGFKPLFDKLSIGELSPDQFLKAYNDRIEEFSAKLQTNQNPISSNGWEEIATSQERFIEAQKEIITSTEDANIALEEMSRVQSEIYSKNHPKNDNSYYLNQRGLNTDEKYSVTEATGFAQTLVSKFQSGSLVSKEYFTDFEKLKKLIYDNDAAIIKLENDISKGAKSGIDTTSLQENLNWLNQARVIMNDEAEKYFNSPQYDSNSYEKQIFEQIRAVREEYAKNKNIFESNKATQKEVENSYRRQISLQTQLNKLDFERWKIEDSGFVKSTRDSRTHLASIKDEMSVYQRFIREEIALRNGARSSDFDDKMQRFDLEELAKRNRLETEYINKQKQVIANRNNLANQKKNNLLNQLKDIQKNYDYKNYNAPKKPVKDASDYKTLNDEFEKIEKSINAINSYTDDFDKKIIDITLRVHDFKRLAEDLESKNNPTKKDLTGIELDSSIKILIEDLNILKAKADSIGNSKLSKNIKNELSALVQNQDFATYEKTIMAFKVLRKQVQKASQDFNNLSRSSRKSFESNYSIIKEYSDAQNKLNDLYIKSIKNPNKYATQIKELEERIKSLKSNADKAYKSIYSLFNSNKISKEQLKKGVLEYNKFDNNSVSNMSKYGDALLENYGGLYSRYINETSKDFGSELSEKLLGELKSAELNIRKYAIKSKNMWLKDALLSGIDNISKEFKNILVQSLIYSINELPNELKGSFGNVLNMSIDELAMSKSNIDKYNNFDFKKYAQNYNDIKDNLIGTSEDVSNFNKMVQLYDNLDISSKNYASDLDTIKDIMNWFLDNGRLATTSQGTIFDVSTNEVNNVQDLTKYLNDYLRAMDATDISIKTVDGSQDKLTATWKNQSKEIITTTASIDNLSHSMRVANQTQGAATGFMSEFGKQSKMIVNSFARYYTGYTLVRKVFSEFKKGIQYLKDYDTALTKISYTMDLSSSELKNLGNSAIELSSNLSLSLDTATEIYQIFANMNSTAEEINTLAEPTAILANISGINASTAADEIQGVINQFDLASDSAMHIADVYTYISSQIAVDFSKGIGSIAEAVEAVGNVAYNAGLSFEQLSAIIATTTEQTRASGSSIGNGLKTIITRLSKASSMADDVSNEDLSNASKALNEIGVSVYEANGEFRDFDIIMTELANRWDTLTDAQQANISYQIAATRQTAVLKAILGNWTKSMELATDATNSNGDAMAAQEKYQKAYIGQLQNITNDAQKIWIHVLDSNSFKSILGFLDDFLKRVDSIATGLGGIPSLITAVSASFSGISLIKSMPIISYNGDNLKGSKWGGIFGNVFNKRTIGRMSNTEFFNSAITDQVQKELTALQGATAGEYKELDKLWSKYNITSQSVKNFTSSTAEATVSLDSQRVVFNNTNDVVASYRNNLSNVAKQSRVTAAATKMLGTAMKVVSAIAWMYIINKIIEVASVVSELIRGVDSLNHTISDISKWESATSEVSSLNNELNTTKDRIKELQKLSSDGTISIVESQELETLKETNRELERKIENQKKIEADEAESYVNDAIRQLKDVNVNSESKKEFNVAKKLAKIDDTLTFGLFGFSDYVDEAYDDIVEKTDVLSGDIYDSIYNIFTNNYSNDDLKKISKNYDSTVSSILLNIDKIVASGKELTAEQKYVYDSYAQLRDAYYYSDYLKNPSGNSFSLIDYDTQKYLFANSLKEVYSLSDSEISAIISKIPDDKIAEFIKKKFIGSLPNANDFVGGLNDWADYVVRIWENTISSGSSINNLGTSNITDVIDFKDDEGYVEKYLSNLNSVEDALSKIYNGEMSHTDVLELLGNKDLGIDPSDVNMLSDSYDGLTDALLKVVDDGYDKILKSVGDLNKYSDPSSVQKYITYLKELQTAALETAKAINSTNKALSALNNLSNDLSAFESAYKAYQEGTFSFDELIALKDKFGTLSSWSDFVEIATANKEFNGTVQQAFNQLITDYMNDPNSEFWNDIDSENVNLFTAWLSRFGINVDEGELKDAVERMGIKNNVEEALRLIDNEAAAQVKTSFSKNGLNYTSESENNILELYNEYMSSGLTSDSFIRNKKEEGGIDSLLENLGMSNATLSYIQDWWENVVNIAEKGYEEVNSQAINNIIALFKGKDLSDEVKKSLLSYAFKNNAISLNSSTSEDEIKSLFELYDTLGYFDGYDIDIESMSADFDSKITSAFELGVTRGFENSTLNSLTSFFKNYNLPDEFSKKLFELVYKAFAESDYNFDNDYLSQIFELMKSSGMFGDNINSDKILSVLNNSNIGLDKKGTFNGISDTIDDIIAKRDKLSKGEIGPEEDRMIKEYDSFIKSFNSGLMTSEYLMNNFSKFSDILTSFGLTSSSTAEEYEDFINSIDSGNKYLIDQAYNLLVNSELAETDREALAQLLLAQIGLNSNSIVTSENIANLLSLADTAGLTTIAITKLGKAYELFMELQDMSEYRNSTGVMRGAYERVKHELEMYLADNPIDLSGLFDLSSYNYNYEALFNSIQTSFDGIDYSGNNDGEKPTTIDWVEIKLKRIQEEIDRLNNKASDTWRSWSERENNLNGDLAKTAELLKANKTAYGTYLSQANKVAQKYGLSNDLIAKIQSGNYSIEDYDSHTAEGIQEYQQWYEKAIAAKDAIEDATDSMATMARTKFDNISKQFEEQISLLEHEKNLIDETINQIQEEGHAVGKSYYDNIYSNTLSQIEEKTKERDALIKQRDAAVASGQITKYSEEWYDMTEQINACDEAIGTLNTSLITTRNNIRQLEWDAFDFFESLSQNVIDEMSFVNDLFREDDLFNDNGSWTSAGLASAGTHQANISMYEDLAAENEKELLKVRADLAKDPNDKELIERYNTLVSKQQEYAKNIKSEQDAIVELYSKGYEKLSSKLKEVADDYMKVLNAEKDMYDYENTIKEKTKNISSLQKQIQAYSGDTSEETQAKVQKLQVDLEKAQEDLENTQYERWLSDQQGMLDTLQDDLGTWIDERLKNVDALLEENKTAVDKNATTISSTISEEASKYGYTMQNEAIKTIFGDNGSIVKDIYNKVDTISEHILSISNSLGRTDTSGSKKNENNYNNGGNKGSGNGSNSKGNGNNSKGNGNSSSSSQGNKKAEVGDKVTVTGSAHWSSEGNEDNIHKPVSISGSHTIKQISKIKGAKYPYLVDDIGWVALNQLKGYATGGKNIKDDWAWTQENGGELIRQSDGSVLTPVKGSTVFNAAQTDALWNLSKALISYNGNSMSDVKTAAIGGGNVAFNGGIIVQANNPTEFAEQLGNALKNNTNIQKMIQATTVDLMTSRNTLSVKKY